MSFLKHETKKLIQYRWKNDVLIEDLLEKIKTAITEQQETEKEDARKLRYSFRFFGFFRFAAP